MKLENILGSKNKIRLLKVLFEDQKKKYNKRQLSIKSKVPYSVTYEYINYFIKIGLVKEKKNLIFLNENYKEYELLKNIFPKKETEFIKKFRKTIRNKEILIILHHNADPDALCSGIALDRGLAQLNVKSKIYSPKGVSKQSKIILKKYPYPIEDEIKKFPEFVFTVDVSSFGQIENMKIPEKSKLIVIDHHEPGNLSKKADTGFIDKNVHSSAILVHDLLKQLNIKITKEIAFFLLVGIITDSAFLRIADKRDMEAINELVKHVDIKKIFSAFSIQTEISEKIAVLKAMRRIEIHKIKDKLIVFSRISSFEAAAARSIISAGADIAIVENIQKKEIRISARARHYLKNKINLVTILKSIEKQIQGTAGGHDLAASANGRNYSSEIRKILLKRLENAFKEKSQVIKR